MKKFAHRFVFAVAGTTLAATLAGVPSPSPAQVPIQGPIQGPRSAAQDGGHRDGPDVTLTRWDSSRDFRSGRMRGLRVRSGELTLASRGKLPKRRYVDPFGDGSPATYEFGSWTSPVQRMDYPVDEAISSWNTHTPTGTWVEIEFRGKHADGGWTKWYVLGRWASGMKFKKGDIHRTSVDGQGDDDANVWTDTFSTKTGKEPVAFQSRVKLMRPAASHRAPSLDQLTTMTSQLMPDAGPTSDFTLGRAVELKVPRYSQNVHTGHYPEFGGGGAVWCSPTSSAMVMRYHGKRFSPSPRELAGIDDDAGVPQVDYAAMHTWDYTYEGAGNWPFNAAYANSYGLDAFVTRLRSLAEVERFVAKGIPVVVSLAFDAEEMPEAGYSTDGHLMVIVGFTADGDPILNDPASNSNAAVRNIYTRENFEKVWIDHSGGVSYLYSRPGQRLPRNVPGETRNW